MTTTSTKYVYFFGNGKAEGQGTWKDLLGGKGAGLAEMTNAGVPVPPGFTITTEACNKFYENGKKVPGGLDAEVRENLARVEAAVGRGFGDPEKPLLVSVRSGAKFSMPGMMDTVLNLGLNDRTVAGLARMTGNERFAWDAYRRFIQMFGSVVLGIEKSAFEEKLSALKAGRHAKLDTDLSADDLKEQIEGGADFATLAQENSLDTVTKSDGGEVGWVSRGVLNEQVEEQLFAQEVNAISTYTTQGGAYVLQVEEKAADRALDDSQKSVLSQKALADWVKEKRDALTVEEFITTNADNFRYVYERAFPQA